MYYVCPYFVFIVVIYIKLVNCCHHNNSSNPFVPVDEHLDHLPAIETTKASTLSTAQPV